MTQPIDEGQRKLIRTALDRTLVVEAAAGTGKTTVLVHRIVAALESRAARVESIVAVTFTEKAAGEMKLRLRGELERARQKRAAGTADRYALEQALAQLEEARVGTIHGFCADLLRERSVEASVDPQFEVLTEPEAERLYGEAFDLWLQQTLEDPPEGVRRSLRRTAQGRGGPGQGPVERLRKAGWTLLEWRDYPESWRRDPFDREGLIDEIAEAVFAFADLTETCAKKEKDNLYRDTERARRVTRQARPAEEVRDRDYDGLEAAFVDLVGDWNFSRPRKGYGKSFGEGVAREEVQAEHARLLERLRAFQRAADADLAARLQADLQEPIARYEILKQRAGRVDFLDLLVRARDLVRDDAGVRAEFQRRFTHLFVDEFQDTDPLQAELLLLLAADDAEETDWRRVTPRPGKLFLVADPKQSIYRFRRADVGLYLEVRDRLAERGAEVLQLSTSFRSVPAIQNVVNAAFPEFLDGNPETQQAAYVPLAPSRGDVPTQPAVVALPVPSPYGRSGRVTNYAVEASYPDAVGAFIHWLLEKSGWTVTERDGGGERVAVAARHVCLLFRRFDSFFAGDVTRPYVEALEARGVRHLLVGGRSFHDREEVETLRTALAAIEWPDDELSVFATLRGSLFAIGDEELLEYRHRFGRLRPLRPRKDLPESVRAVGDALGVLRKLHLPRNRRPIAETVNRLLETTRAHAGFVLRPSGEQALANVLHVAEQARSYEGTGGISFRGFVERLAEDAEGRKAQEAPILEEGSEGVRLMTVHKAKGLEFPVVVLVDPTATLAFENPGRAIADGRRQCALRIAGWSPVELNEARDREVARDVAEGVRLTYVAATRARDLLVVPVFGDGAHQDVRSEPSAARAGWLSPLSGVLYPGQDAWTEPETVPGAPSFGRDSVVDRPFDPGPGPAGVRPGLYHLEGRSVAWWDPAALSLGAEPSDGVRQAELLAKDADPEIVRQGASRYRLWVESQEETRSRAAAPTESVRTATEWAAVTAEDAGDVAVVELPRAKRRPAGPRFGALVHAVLATAPLSADAERVRQVVELQGRILGATDKESTAASEVVRNVLAHPLLERARGAEERGECRRETPVAARFGEVLVEGVVDLAFREKGRWIVVDFKTDQEIERELDVYRRQVGLYAAVIGKATGEPSEPVLMRV